MRTAEIAQEHFLSLELDISKVYCNPLHKPCKKEQKVNVLSMSAVRPHQDFGVLGPFSIYINVSLV